MSWLDRPPMREQSRPKCLITRRIFNMNSIWSILLIISLQWW